MVASTLHAASSLPLRTPVSAPHIAARSSAAAPHARQYHTTRAAAARRGPRGTGRTVVDDNNDDDDDEAVATRDPRKLAGARPSTNSRMNPFSLPLGAGAGLGAGMGMAGAGMSDDKVDMMQRMVAMLSAPITPESKREAEKLMREAEAMGMVDDVRQSVRN